MGFIQDNAEKLDVADLGQKIRVSTNQLERAIASVKGPSRKDLAEGFKFLKARAREGAVASKHSNMIEILKPEVFSEGEEAVTYEMINGVDMGFEKVH